MNRSITITRERLEKARTPKGGYNNAQFKVIGLKVPVRKGWKNELIGSEVTLRTFITFVKAGKNKLYLAQILDSLDTLNPPLIEPLDDNIESSMLITPKRLNKKEFKKERFAQKRAERNYEKEQRIVEYGVHASINLIFEKAGSSIYYSDRKFLNEILNISSQKIPSCDVLRLYGILKKHGIILSRRITGQITPSGITKISEIRKTQFLYIIREKNGKYLKIGVSKDPSSRKKALQTSNPNILVVQMVFITNENAVKLEKSLHRFFHKERKKGEWFENITDQEIIKAIGSRGSLTKEY